LQIGQPDIATVFHFYPDSREIGEYNKMQVPPTPHYRSVDNRRFSMQWCTHIVTMSTTNSVLVDDR